MNNYTYESREPSAEWKDSKRHSTLYLGGGMVYLVVNLHDPKVWICYELGERIEQRFDSREEAKRHCEKLAIKMFDEISEVMGELEKRRSVKEVDDESIRMGKCS